jgi:hypothetical protein
LVRPTPVWGSEVLLDAGEVPEAGVLLVPPEPQALISAAASPSAITAPSRRRTLLEMLIPAVLLQFGSGPPNADEGGDQHPTGIRTLHW